MWWISYRGEGKAGVDNIGVFEDDGTPRKQHPLLLDPSPKAHPLHIARAFALVGDDLYIANAWRKDSHIARYRRHGDTFRFAEVVVASKHVSAMVHPFDVDLGDDGRLYVSCQDTNTVLAIQPKTRKPAPVASHLRKTFPKGNFLPGTLVASCQGRLPEVGDQPPLDVPSPQGLKVVLDVHGKPRHSVRGIIVHRKHLYVAGEAGDVVKVFELKTGRLVARIRGKQAREARAPRPARRDALHRRRRHRQHPRLRHPRRGSARQAQGARGDRRKAQGPVRLRDRPGRRSLRGRTVRSADAALLLKGKKKGTFIDGLPDMPEFLVHMPDPA